MKLWNLDGLWCRLSSPRRWKVATRRAFILILRLSLPLWMLAIIGVLGACSLLAMGRAFATFWSEPPKRRYSYYRYPARRLSPNEARTIEQFKNLLRANENVQLAA